MRKVLAVGRWVLGIVFWLSSGFKSSVIALRRYFVKVLFRGIWNVEPGTQEPGMRKVLAVGRWVLGIECWLSSGFNSIVIALRRCFEESGTQESGTLTPSTWVRAIVRYSVNRICVILSVPPLPGAIWYTYPETGFAIPGPRRPAYPRSG